MGADFIEWSWDPTEGAGAPTSAEYEVEWAFWEDRIGARNAIRTTEPRYRLPVEPDTTAWLRVRSAERPDVEASAWSPAVPGSSPAARCFAPEITASRPREAGALWYLVNNRVTIDRPAETRRPLVRILQPYYDTGIPGARHDLFLVARFSSWTTTRRGGSVRDELSFDWPHDRNIAVWFEGIAPDLDPDLHLEIAAAGCPEVVTVRCTSQRCTVDP